MPKDIAIIQMHTHTGEKSYFFITNKQCGKANATAQEIQNALENKENIEEIIIYNIKIDINTPKNNPIPIFIHLFLIKTPLFEKEKSFDFSYAFISSVDDCSTFASVKSAEISSPLTTF